MSPIDGHFEGPWWYTTKTHTWHYYTMKFFICSILSWLTSSNKLSGRRKNHLVKENLFLSQNNVWKKLSIFSRSPIFWKDTMSHCLKRFVYECNRYKFYGCYENNINFLIMIFSEREIVIFVCFDGFKSFKSDKRNPSIFLLKKKRIKSNLKKRMKNLKHCMGIILICWIGIHLSHTKNDWQVDRYMYTPYWASNWPPTGVRYWLSDGGPYRG